ncbi:MAG: hypothetical protein K6348_05625 [Deferribacterales bacterium]
MKKLMMLIMILGTTTTLFADWSQKSSNGKIKLGDKVFEEVGLSNGVNAGYTGSPSAYGIGTVHQSGTKSYGASSASSSIYYSVPQDTTKPTEVSAGQSGSDWDSTTWTLEGK